MSEPRGSSWNTAAPLLDAPAGGDEGVLLVSDDAPTRIKRPGSSDRSPVSVISDSDRELIGASLDHFELLDCIGAGGMGRVFRARDSRLDRLVALKVLDPDLAKDEEICRRFEQEARAAARLDDPHFAHVYYYGNAKGLHFIAMEFVAGENLRKRIDRHGRLDVAEAVDVGLQIARGLHHAASCGVIHRDIKPSNIIVTPHGLAKLVDMGLARYVLESSSSYELTHPGVTLGTFDYISPEQARDPRAVDVRSDIYSLGCTLYHALTGRPPFPDGAGLQKLLQHQSDAVQDPRHFVPDLPESLVLVLLKMMAKNPLDRYQTPAALIRDLGALAEWLDLPYVAEPGYADVVGVGERFWERQLVWLVPMLLFLTAVGIYSAVYRSAPALPMPREPVAVAPSVAAAPLEQSKPSVEPAPVADVNPSARSTGGSATGQTEILVVKSGDELRDKIVTAKPDSVLELDFDEYTLTLGENGTPRLPRIDKNLTIRSKRKVTTVHVDAASANRGGSGGAVFTVGGGDVLFQNLRFTMRLGDIIGDLPSFVLLEEGVMRLHACDFQVFGRGGTLVELRPGRSPKACQLSAENCHFGGAADGILLRGFGDMRLKLQNCAFRPFARAIRWEGMGKPGIELQQVSMITAAAPVISVDSVFEGLLRVSDSVFSCLPGTTRPAVVVSVDRADPPNRTMPWWTGERNLYHGFDDGPIELGGLRRIDFTESAANGFKESTEVVQMGAADSPFAQPLDAAALTLTTVDPDPVRHFRLSARTATLLKNQRHTRTGVWEGPTGAVYAAEPIRDEEPRRNNSTASPPAAPLATAAPIFVVDPLAVDGPRPAGVYRHLATACREAGTARTIIELRTNDMLDEQDVPVQGELVLRPAKGFQPLLRLRAGDGADSAAPRLFRLASRARLRIEGIPLFVDPAPELSAAGVAMFDCAEGSRVDLAGLWVQFSRESTAATTAVFSVRTPGGSTTIRNGMPLEAPRFDPVALTMTRCGVRSSGALLAADPAGFWSLNVEDCYVSAQKSAVWVSGAPVPLGQAGQNILDVAGTTFILRDSLAAVVVGDGAQPENPRTIAAAANHCVFIGVGNEPFTRTAGAHSATYQQDSITWTGAENFVAGYETLFRYEGRADGMMRRIEPRSLDGRAWLDHWKLSATSFRLGPTVLPAAIKSLKSVPTSDDLRLLDFPESLDVEIGVSARLLPSPPRS